VTTIRVRHFTGSRRLSYGGDACAAIYATSDLMISRRPRFVRRPPGETR
jgi:hypothetical protein